MKSVKYPWRKVADKVTCGGRGRGFGNDTNTYSSTFYVGAKYRVDQSPYAFGDPK